MTTADYLVNRLAVIYKNHDYDVPPEKMKYIIECLNKTFEINLMSTKGIDDFINEIESGKFGILYKQPTCIASMWYKYSEKFRMVY